MSKILFSANPKPSKLVKRMWKHKCDVSEGSQAKVMAKRTILGMKVTFYESGLRVVEDNDLSEEDEYNSEILRLAHASILIGGPVGDKKILYVDATFNPVKIFIYNMSAEMYIKKAKMAVKAGQISEDFVLGSHIRKIEESTDDRHVRLFGSRVDKAPIQDR